MVSIILTMVVIVVGITACIVLLQQGDTFAQVFDYLVAYVAVPFGLFLFCYLMTSVWYCIVVSLKFTLYPKWMALLNPSCPRW